MSDTPDTQNQNVVRPSNYIKTPFVKKLEQELGMDFLVHQLRVIDEAINKTKNDSTGIRKLLVWGTGTGKTLGGLGILRSINDKNYAIVVPAAVKPQFSIWAQRMKLDPDRVMSYHQFIKSKIKPTTVLVDEAHRLGSETSIQSKLILPKLLQAKNVVLLTATPIKNNIREFAPIYSVLKGYYVDPQDFEKNFGIKDPPRWKVWLKDKLKLPIDTGQDYSGIAKAVEEVKDQIDYVPSTTHNIDVKEEMVDTDLSEKQKYILKAITTSRLENIPFYLRHRYKFDPENIRNYRTFLIGERQITLSDLPFKKGPITDDDIYQSFLDSPKLRKVFEDIVDFLNNEQGNIVVYSNFPYAGLLPLSEALKRKGIGHSFFHGDMTAKERLAAIQDYNSGKNRVILIGPAGSEGISLKNTRLVQILDPYWNEARMIQAKARGIRADSHINLPKELQNARIVYYFTRNPQENQSSIERLIEKIKKLISRLGPYNIDTYEEKVKPKVKTVKSLTSPESRLLDITREKSEIFNRLIENIKSTKTASVNEIADKFIEFLKTEIAFSTQELKKAACIIIQTNPHVLENMFIRLLEKIESMSMKSKKASYREEQKGYENYSSHTSITIPKDIVNKKGILADLLLAKYFSDANEFRMKLHIIRSLVSKDPKSWMVDSYQGYTVGITHKPTNFRFHVPKHMIEDLLGDQIREYIEREKRKL